ncbi:hypothetical protein OIDMADRAFT_39718 [Oidiodendron maius Zn]|uniref:Hemerythrin-like domain-containing protein n=1 Tax=Oidiodendron maius (strain Zn) TaxID=913774 RepID=A0A0C3HJU6_OIDMZ|nr:hypothetical protein OIDMADRAFT_39718 [Oidiodendron maius Zn]
MATLLSTISRDHSEIVQYYKNILDSPDNETATRWYNQFSWALSRHLKAEELVVYPALKNRLGKKGKIIVEKDQLEIQTIQMKLENIRSVKVDSTEFVPALESLINDTAGHFNEVEMADLPALDGVLSLGESKRLSESFMRVKLPDLLHSHTSNGFLFSAPFSWLAAPVNFLCNIPRKYPDKTMTRKDATKTDEMG